MQKKIKTETALGIIFIIAVLVGGSLYALSRQDFGIADRVLKKKPVASSKNQGKDLRLLFATNGNRKIYKVQKGDKWVVEIDGEQSEAYDSVDNPVFSPDGTQFVFSATLDGRAFIVLNNEAWERYYNRILQIIWSPDGKTLAYVAERSGNNLVVLDGQEGNEYSSITSFDTSGGSTYLIFSSDGQNVAYKVTNEEGSFMVINGEVSPVYDDIFNFYFDEDGNYTYDAQDGGESITVVNNQVVDKDTTAATSTNQSTTSAGTSTSTNTSSSSGSPNTSKTSSTKNKKIQPDTNLDESRLFYPACTGSGSDKQCNF